MNFPRFRIGVFVVFSIFIETIQSAPSHDHLLSEISNFVSPILTPDEEKQSVKLAQDVAAELEVLVEGLPIESFRGDPILKQHKHFDTSVYKLPNNGPTVYVRNGNDVGKKAIVLLPGEDGMVIRKIKKIYVALKKVPGADGDYHPFYIYIRESTDNDADTIMIQLGGSKKVIEYDSWVYHSKEFDGSDKSKAFGWTKCGPSIFVPCLSQETLKQAGGTKLQSLNGKDTAAHKPKTIRKRPLVSTTDTFKTEKNFKIDENIDLFTDIEEMEHVQEDRSLEENKIKTDSKLGQRKAQLAVDTEVGILSSVLSKFVGGVSSLTQGLTGLFGFMGTKSVGDIDFKDIEHVGHAHKIQKREADTNTEKKVAVAAESGSGNEKKIAEGVAIADDDRDKRQAQGQQGGGGGGLSADASLNFANLLGSIGLGGGNPEGKDPNPGKGLLEVGLNLADVPGTLFGAVLPGPNGAAGGVPLLQAGLGGVGSVVGGVGNLATGVIGGVTGAVGGLVNSLFAGGGPLAGLGKIGEIVQVPLQIVNSLVGTLGNLLSGIFNFGGIFGGGAQGGQDKPLEVGLNLLGGFGGLLGGNHGPAALVNVTLGGVLGGVGGIFNALTSTATHLVGAAAGLIGKVVGGVLSVGSGLVNQVSEYGGLGSNGANPGLIGKTLGMVGLDNLLGGLKGNERKEADQELKNQESGGLGGILEIDIDLLAAANATGGNTTATDGTDANENVATYDRRKKRSIVGQPNNKQVLETDLFLHRGWKTIGASGKPGDTLAHESSDAFVGYGACPYMPITKMDWELAANTEDLIELIATALRTYCIPQEMALYQELVTGGYVKLGAHQTIEIDSKHKTFNLDKMSPNDASIFTRAFEMSTFSHAFQKELYAVKPHVSGGISGSKVTRRVYVLGQSILKGIEDAKTTLRHHHVKILRNLALTAKTAFLKLSQDEELIQDCEECAADKEANAADLQHVMGLLEFIIHGLAPIDHGKEKSAAESFEYFAHVNKYLISEKVRHAL